MPAKSNLVTAMARVDDTAEVTEMVGANVMRKTQETGELVEKKIASTGSKMAREGLIGIVTPKEAGAIDSKELRRMRGKSSTVAQMLMGLTR